MRRLVESGVAARRAFPAAILIVVVMCLFPVRWLGWLAGPASGVSAVLAPISGSSRRVADWVRPAAVREADPAEIARLKQESQTYRTQLLQEQAENSRLRRQIAELSGLRELRPDLELRLLTRPVIATSSDLSSRILTVRAGERDGVGVNTVATVGGVQLLGRVVESSGRQCKVQPITSKAAGTILGRVMVGGVGGVGDVGGEGRACSLKPVGDGTLTGTFEEGSGAAPESIPAGTEVRLDDSSWPGAAQRLLIGTVTAIETSKDNPLFRVVTVRPAQELWRVSEVVLWAGGGDEEAGS